MNALQQIACAVLLVLTAASLLLAFEDQIAAFVFGLIKQLL